MMAKTIPPRKPTPRRKQCPKYPVTVACRDYLLDTFPALKDGTDAQSYRGLAAYFLFGTFYDWDSGQLVIPFTNIAQHVGSHPKGYKFTALDWLNKFNDNVWPIKWSAKDYEKREARECLASPNDKVVACVFELNLEEPGSGKSLTDDLLDLVTGASYSRRNQDQLSTSMHKAIDIPANHPARDFAIFLNDQPQHTYKAVVRRNWNRAVISCQKMPTSTQKEILRKVYGFIMLTNIRKIQRQYYSGKKNTQRLFSLHPSVNELPREIRKEILQDCVVLDARSIQLAIASHLWNMPTTYSFLKEGNNIWEDIATHMCVDQEWKPFFKEALYSILFGRSQSELRYFLETGREPSQRGKESHLSPLPISLRTSQKVDLFLAHTIIAECVVAQANRLSKINTDKSITEASGLKRTLNPAGGVDAKSLLAAEVQSWEISLISNLLPVFKQYKRDVRIVSFLHDGLALSFTESSRTSTIIEQIKQSFKLYATSLDIPTELVIGD